MPRPIILDCDPGHDDALAILFAHGDPDIDLLAVTTVAGNQTLDKTTLNARRVCSVAGIDHVPLAAGADRPLRRPLRTAGAVHGESGLDGPVFDEPAVEVTGEHAVDLMHRVIDGHPRPVTLVPIGPLTNIALLLRRHPDVREGIEKIVLMGGSAWRGNVTPYAEFNIHTDPEAAAEVFGSGIPVTMIGLDVTHQAPVTPEVVERFAALGTATGQMCVELFEFFGGAYERRYGLRAPPLHDPVALARVIDPTLVDCVRAPVAIETAGEFTSGATVVDLLHVTGAADNAWVATALDVPRFWDRLVEAVRNCG
ncbi:pyrimidine-specific ribonucleoside hydrolase RihA [soil metagenome]